MDNIEFTKRKRTYGDNASEEPPVKKSKFNPPVDKPLNAGNLAQRGQEINYNQRGLPMPIPIHIHIRQRKMTIQAAPPPQYSNNARLKKAIFDYLQAVQASHKEDLKQQIKNLIQEDFAAFVPCENISFQMVNPPINKEIIGLLNQVINGQEKKIKKRQFDEIQKLVANLNADTFYQNCASSDTVLHSLFRFFSFEGIIQHTTQLGQWIEKFQCLNQKALPVEALEELKGACMGVIQGDDCVTILDNYLNHQSKIMKKQVKPQDFDREVNQPSKQNKVNCIQTIRVYFNSFLEACQQDSLKHSCASLIAKDLIKNLESSLPDAWDSSSLFLKAMSREKVSIDFSKLRDDTNQTYRQDINTQLRNSLSSSIESFYQKRKEGLDYLDQTIVLLQAQDNAYHTGIDGQLQAIEEVLEIVTTLSEKLSDQAEIFKIDLNADAKGQTALDVLALAVPKFIEMLSEPKTAPLSENIRAKIQGYFIRFVKLLNLLSNGDAVSENSEILLSKEDRHAFLNLLGLVPDLQHYDKLFYFIYDRSFDPDIAFEDEVEPDLWTKDISCLEQDPDGVDVWTADEASRSPIKGEVYLCRELYGHLKNEDADAAQRLMHHKEIFLEHRQTLLRFLCGKDNIAQYDSLLSYIYFYIPFLKKDSMSDSSDGDGDL